MKVTIEKDDIVQGAEFIMPLQAATGQFNQLTIMNHLGQLVVANRSVARITHSGDTPEEIAAHLTANRCIPPWLHEAQQAEQAKATPVRPQAAVASQYPGGQRQQNQEGQSPAQEVQRDRWHQGVDHAAHDGIARPEQGRHGQQQSGDRSEFLRHAETVSVFGFPLCRTAVLARRSGMQFMAQSCIV